MTGVQTCALPILPTDVLKEVLDRAGKYWGIGDWRPGTKGIHGKFMVTEFKEVK